MRGAKLTNPYALRTDSIIKKVLAGVISLLFFLDIYSIYAAYQSRTVFESIAERKNENSVQILAQYTEGMIRQLDTTMQTVADEIVRVTSSPGDHGKYINAYIERHYLRLQNVEAIRFANTEGDVIYGTKVDSNNVISIADRDYFIKLSGNSDQEFEISNPVFGKISKRWVTIFARKVKNSKGEMIGIVYVPQSIDTFRTMLMNSKNGEFDEINFHDQDFNIVLSFSSKLHAYPQLQPFRNNALYEKFKSGQESGQAFALSSTDNILRNYYYKSIKKLSLAISSGTAPKEYLEPWRNNFNKEIVTLAVLNLVVVLFSFFIYLGWKKEQKNIQMLAEQEIKFKTIADYTFNWEFWLSPDKKFIFTSPSSFKITGWTSEELYAKPDLLLSIIHPDDKKIFLFNLGWNTEGIPQVKEKMNLRFIHKNGEIRWCEYLSYRIFDHEGKYLGLRGSFRDMTDWKIMEDALREARDHR